MNHTTTTTVDTDTTTQATDSTFARTTLEPIVTKSLVIPFKYGAGDSVDLRYALRGWTKFGPPIQDCYLIGNDLPLWYYGANISHTQDVKFPAVVNVLGKLRSACLDPRVTEDFIWSNDDIFLIKQFLEGPFYMVNPPHRQGDVHHKGMQLTVDELDRRRITKWYDCELHAPCVYNKAKCLQLLGEIDIKLPYSFRTLYFNIHGGQLAPMNDCKIFEWMEPKPAYRGFFWSTNDSCLSTKKFQEWAEKTYTDKSNWEA